MKIGPKYKLARRLGAPIFEKTQTQKFVLSQQKKEKTKGKRGFSGARSEFGTQLLEKQKARLMYGITEKQFARYAKEAIAKKDTHAASRLYAALEMRLDSIVYKLGLAPSRRAGRQMVSHGHITVNGKKVTIPSMRMSIGDKIAVRDGSAGSALFAEMDKRMQETEIPAWLKYDAKEKVATVEAIPTAEGANLLFDLTLILEFYSR